jgi:protein gp37
VAGCAVISPGCSNCYAMRMAARLDAMGVAKYQGLTRKSGRRHVWTGRVRLDEASLSIPSMWRKPRLVFVNSMSDLFHEDVPDDFVARVVETMRTVSHHTYQVLTKRPERMAALMARLVPQPLPNVWLGTSIENADHLHRLDPLRRTPARVRFVSLEPLLGPLPGLDLSGIQWTIVGGESGPGARPIQTEWVDEIELASRRAGSAFFFKQWGGTNKKASGRTYRGRTWDQMPAFSAASWG